MNRPRINLSQNYISTQSREDYFLSTYSQISQEQQNFPELISNNHNQIMTMDCIQINSNFYKEEDFGNSLNLNEETHKIKQKNEYINQIRNQYNVLINPVLKLNIHKLNPLTNDKDLLSVHYISPYGLVGTKRTISDYFVRIGRLQNDENGMIQNDLILSSDRSISRCHFRIDYMDGFKFIRRLPDEYAALLMMNHPRLGNNINVPHIPHHLLYNIFSYLSNKRQFYLIDCGSILGTYIKLRFNERYFLNRAQIYGIGSEFSIIVKEIYICDIYPKLFMDYILDQKRNAVIILGLSEEFHMFLANSTPQQRNIMNFQFPSKTCLKIDIININQNEPSRSYILFANEFQKEFKIGRVGSSDIIIQNTTISREQARIGYCDITYKWYILDGSQQKSSLNGTWLSVTNATQKFNREESERYPLKHGDEIKISDFSLTVEEININKHVTDLYCIY